MTKKVIQDIVPPLKRKSIRDIPIPTHRRKVSNGSSVDVDNQKEDIILVNEQKREKIEIESVKNYEETYDETVVEKSTKHKRLRLKKWPIVSVAVGILLIIIFIFSIGGVEAQVYPKKIITTVNSEIQASNISSDSNSPVGFTTVEITENSSRTITATGEEKVTEKASGTITIYNEYTEEDQRLVKNTRFKSPEGLIYRIPESVVVPGLTRNSNGDVVPGKIEAEVFADEAGDKYNIEKERFTIPGFEGLPQFDGFYAQSKTNITGGFDGVRKIISESDRNKAESELRKELEEKLSDSSKKDVTPGLIDFSNPSTQIYEVTDESYSGDNVTISMRGTSKVILLEILELSNALASANINSFNSEEESVLIKNVDELDVDVLLVDSSDLDQKSVTISVSGTAEFVWQTDLDKLAKSLAGKEIKDLRQILENFPGISKIEVEKKAFWKKTFPDDSDDINIVIEEE